MSALRVALVAAVIAAFASCRGGCGREDSPPSVSTDSPLRLFPADVGMVVIADVAKLRQAPILGKLARGKSNPILERGLASVERELGVYAKATGFHPLNDVDSVAMATAANENSGGVIVRGRHLDEKRLVDYMKTSKGKDVGLVSTRRGAHTLWSTRKLPDAAAVFLDDKTLLIGYGGWAEQMADLADGVPAARAAATNAQAVRSLAGVSGHAIAGVSLGTDAIGRLMQRLDAGTAGGSVLRQATWTIDAGQKVVVHVDADFIGAAEAKAAAERWGKGVPGSPLASVLKATADGPKLRVDADLDDELLGKLVMFAGMLATAPLVHTD